MEDYNKTRVYFFFCLGKFLFPFILVGCYLLTEKILRRVRSFVDS